MTKPAFLVAHADARPTDDFTIEREVVEAASGELRLVSADSEDERIEQLQDADAVLVRSALITRRIIEGLPRCQVLVRYGVGIDTLDIEAATEHGIAIAHFPDFCQPEVANHALALLLSCVKRVPQLDRAVRSGQWRGGPLAPMQHITGQTLGLVAFGAIAQALARRAQALDLEVIAFDPYAPDEAFASAGVERVQTLDALLERSDYVSLHTPLTHETHHLIGAEQLQRMKPTAYLINTSRGPIIDETALVEALQDSTIAGAGLDVFEQEPLAADSPLAQLDNVVLTPHSASYSDRAFADLKRRVAEAAVDVVARRRWPQFVANRAQIEGRTRASLD